LSRRFLSGRCMPPGVTPLPALVAVGLGIGSLWAWQDASQIGGGWPTPRPPWGSAKAGPAVAVSIKLPVTAKAKPMVLLVAGIKTLLMVAVVNAVGENTPAPVIGLPWARRVTLSHDLTRLFWRRARSRLAR
jgi:hypothetical protein